MCVMTHLAIYLGVLNSNAFLGGIQHVELKRVFLSSYLWSQREVLMTN